MARETPNMSAVKRWSFRIIPFFIFGTFGVASYAIAGHICVQYIYRYQGKPGLAAGLMVLYFLFLILTIVSYARVFFTIQFDPGLVPLTTDRGHDATEVPEKRRRYRSRRHIDPEEPPWIPPDLSPDSPGLEAFYSKDVFVCEADGRPKWCSHCRQWKPDRAHHSRELGRCVKKMDHLCPWVGGMVSETSFNFFTQFVFYTFCLCSLCLGIAVYSLTQQLNSDSISVDGWVIAAIAVSAFFGLFALGMTLTAGRFIFTNITNIDVLRRRQAFNLAVLIPRGAAPSTKYQTITYPLLPGAPGSAMLRQADGALGPISARDQGAFRTFAIVRTEPHENPWDLGFWKNWKSVMGNNPLEWTLPIKHSPCCNHDDMRSDYALGPLLDDLKKRYDLPDETTKTYAPSV